MFQKLDLIKQFHFNYKESKQLKNTGGPRWTANTEFADKKTHFDLKYRHLDQFYIC